MCDTKKATIKDNHKYLEGNYSDNAYEAYLQQLEDSQQAHELSIAEEYMKAYLQGLKSQRKEHHYLVDGAILTCTHCTMEPKTPFSKTFTAPAGSDQVILKVTSHTSYKNDAGQIFATTKDCSKDNISAFGNCKNPPDREEEKKAIEIAEKSDELLQLGNCRYLRKLNRCWENLISDKDYQEITLMNHMVYKEITMESILFCQHGGFIYPIDPGYIASEVDETELTPEEKEFAKKYGLTDEQCKALFDIRKYLEENPDLANGTTVFAFEGLGIKLMEGEESSWNGKNTYHPNGQFGAILIVTKDGRLFYAETRASTLPDNMEKSATVVEGIYKLVAAKHKKDDPNGYAAAQLRTLDSGSATVPAYNSIHGNDTASGINLHMAGKIKSDEPVYSVGCITVTVDRYRDFGVATGFIKDLESNKSAGSTGSYSEGKSNLSYDKNSVKDFEGYIVINRDYCSEDVKEFLR